MLTLVLVNQHNSLFCEVLAVAHVRSHGNSGTPNVPDSVVPPLLHTEHHPAT